jgi:coniferyl-aldehyde dehydrogenase
MNARSPEQDLAAMPAEFRQTFDAQRAAYLAQPETSCAQRRADLAALVRLLKENRQPIIDAINADYGNRSEFETLFAEYFGALDGLKFTAKNLRKWMRPQSRHIDQGLYPLARNRVVPQPLGVVGVIVPWNLPLFLSFGPLACIIGAGNRAMVKMSENSRHLATLLMEISPRYLPVEKLRFFDDGGGRGPAFSSLPFDHLLFTGSGSTGRAVMASAARNLTPVTLELGGKAPAVIAPDYPLEKAAERVLWAKMINAGQVCVNIDYLFIPEGKEEEFAAHCKRLFAQRYPDMNGPDYTSIIDERAYQRLEGHLEDARAKGARLVNLAEGQTPDRAMRKFPPHLVFGPTADMDVSTREMFGPILPVRTYRNEREVADYINAHDRPLAFYPFTNDKRLQQFYIGNVMSGGVSVNEAMLHGAQHSLPFGGVGASGMGHYHGQEGFNAFSKLRPVFYQGPLSAIQMLFQPPYQGLPMKVMNLIIKLKT